jgi:hypothetical protein
MVPKEWRVSILGKDPSPLKFLSAYSSETLRIPWRYYFEHQTGREILRDKEGDSSSVFL